MPVLMVATYNKDGSVNVMNEFPLCLECEFIEYQDNAYGCGVIYNHINTAKMVGCFNHIIYIKNFIFYSYHICFENISCLIMCQTASFHMI